MRRRRAGGGAVGNVDQRVRQRCLSARGECVATRGSDTYSNQVNFLMRGPRASIIVSCRFLTGSRNVFEQH